MVGAVAGADGEGGTVADVETGITGVEGDGAVAPVGGTIVAVVDAVTTGDVVGDVVAELPHAVASKPSDSAAITGVNR